MSDINFLNDKKQDDDQGQKGKDKDNVIWSEPDDKKPVPKGTPFFALPFLNKKKKTEAPAKSLMVDRSKIKESRQEILRLIKQNKSQELDNKDNKPVKGDSMSSRLADALFRLAESRRAGQAGRNGDLGGKRDGYLSAGMPEKPKKQPSRKEALIEYQQAFDHEKIKRRQQPEAKPEQNKQILSQPVKKENFVKPAKELRSVFWANIFKTLKNRIAAILHKNKPAKVDFADKIKQPEPENGPVIQAQPIEKKEEKKIEAEPLKQTDPIQIDGGRIKVVETNLIKGEIITFFDWRKKIIGLIGAILIPIFILFLVHFSLAFYQQQNQAKIQDQASKLSELTEKIKQAELGLKENAEFQARLKIVSKIFAEHLYWTNFFNFLENNTIKEVYYNGFAGDTSGDYSLDAFALRFSDISEQVNALQNNDKVTNVTTAGGDLVVDSKDKKSRVQFNLKFSVLNSIFTD